MDRELIKKALECCVDCNTICNSEKCYLFDKFKYSQCVEQLKKDILTLINELESENKKLLKENESLNGSWKNALKRIAVLVKEIVLCDGTMLEETKESVEEDAEREKHCKECQDQTLTMFAEWLTKRSNNLIYIDLAKKYIKELL